MATKSRDHTPGYHLEAEELLPCLLRIGMEHVERRSLSKAQFGDSVFFLMGEWHDETANRPAAVQAFLESLGMNDFDLQAALRRAGHKCKDLNLRERLFELAKTVRYYGHR